jgi:hypothetical protein
MSDFLIQYPDVEAYLDDSETFTNTAQEVVGPDNTRYLIVTQTGEEASGQLLFSIDANGSVTFLLGDTLVDPLKGPQVMGVASGSYIPSSAEDHAKVAVTMETEAGHFSSANGPDGGNLACVWTMRRIVKEALGRDITHTDKTNTLVSELQAGFDASGGFNEADVPTGGLIISPGRQLPGQKKYRHGHVGLMAEPQKDRSRSVYSNSSTRALWIENGTVESWYVDHSGLETYFFPIPAPKYI